MVTPAYDQKRKSHYISFLSFLVSFLFSFAFPHTGETFLTRIFRLISKAIFIMICFYCTRMLNERYKLHNQFELKSVYFV